MELVEQILLQVNPLIDDGKVSVFAKRVSRVHTVKTSLENRIRSSDLVPNSYILEEVIILWLLA